MQLTKKLRLYNRKSYCDKLEIKCHDAWKYNMATLVEDTCLSLENFLGLIKVISSPLITLESGDHWFLFHLIPTYMSCVIIVCCENSLAKIKSRPERNFVQVLTFMLRM